MARGHLFVIVLLLAAAAMAGLLAIARTTQAKPASATEPAITFRMQTKLDRLEASLQRQLARQRKAGQSTPFLVSTPATAPTVSTTHHDDEEEEDERREHEENDRDD